MFLCSKNHYCENECTAKCNLHIQCYPIKVAMALFTELEPNKNKNKQINNPKKNPHHNKTKNLIKKLKVSHT